MKFSFKCNYRVVIPWHTDTVGNHSRLHSGVSRSPPLFMSGSIRLHMSRKWMESGPTRFGIGEGQTWLKISLAPLSGEKAMATINYFQLAERRHLDDVRREKKIREHVIQEVLDLPPMCSSLGHISLTSPSMSLPQSVFLSYVTWSLYWNRTPKVNCWNGWRLLCALSKSKGCLLCPVMFLPMGKRVATPGVFLPLRRGGHLLEFPSFLAQLTITSPRARAPFFRPPMWGRKHYSKSLPESGRVP